MVMSSLGTNALPNLTRIMLDVKHPRAADAEQSLLDLRESGSNVVSSVQALQAAVHGADPQLAARAQKILNRLEAPPATNAVTRTNSPSP
jgi:hypothetical protein